MDMWQQYKDAVKAALPKATIIVDKFHIVRMANQALETIRKQLREALSPKERRGLMHDRFILLKRHKELTEQDLIKLKLWTKNHHSLSIAYDLKEFELWDSSGRQEAYLKYHDWKVTIPGELKSAFDPLTKAMANWEEEIFNYFNHRITNAYTESLNSLIRIVNRLGRRYSFEALRAKLLYTEGLQKERRPKHQKCLDDYELRDYNFSMFDKMPPID
uniref:transposase n=1 Tax=Paenibacillus tyrfis TaxID=1501230 RepID=UPI00286BD855|nr:transposase [Paenibacillus tyrfis]